MFYFLKLIFVFLYAFSSSELKTAAPVPIPTPSPNKITDRSIFNCLVDKIEANVIANRYMEQGCSEKPCCKPLSKPLKGWEGFPLKECHYSVEICKTKAHFKGWHESCEKKGSTKSGAVSAKVVMMNPDAKTLANWIIDACSYVNKKRGEIQKKCVQHLYDKMRIATQAQFPVSGIVLEDMEHTGKTDAFIFRDGVTIKLPAQESYKYGYEQLNPEDKSAQEQILNDLYEKTLNADKYPSKHVYQFGRPISLTREAYARYAKETDGINYVDVGRSKPPELRKLNWNQVIKDLYKRSWGKEANHILRAYALSNTHLMTDELYEGSVPICR